MAHAAATESLRNAIIDFIAGSLGGTALVYVGQPLDTVKVKMQTFPTLYTGMIDCCRKTVKSDGFIKGLYAGTVPAIVANIAENSVLFAGYGYCQKLILMLSNQNKLQDLSVYQNALAGSLASFGSSLTLCPTELIKCKLQAMREMHHLYPEMYKTKIGPMTLTRQIIKQHGVQGLFHGIGTTIFREMPGYFFFFGGYEGTREVLRAPNQNKDDIGILKTMAAGAVGGLVLWIVIFPIDLVKSRIQVSNVQSSSTAVTLNILKNEGIFALYSGLLPTLVRTVPATAVLFVVVEYSKKYMTSFFEC